MGTWAPVVYAPTFKVDFHLIVAPPALAMGAGGAWLDAFVLPALDGAERLEKSQHWALFQNEQWRVFGVGCRATALAAPGEARVHDDHNRPLFLFAGFAAQRSDQEGFPLPLMCDTDLAPFKALYDVVLDHWDEERLIATDTSIQHPPMFRTSLRPNAAYLAMLNADVGHVALWPDTKSYRAQLWQAISASTGPVSLLLGFANTDSAHRAPYLNGTAQDITSTTMLTK